MKLRKKIKVTNEHGLHIRPASIFAETAKSHRSTVVVSKGGEDVDGRSIMEILSLGINSGHEVVLEVDGPDAERAMSALESILVGNL